MPEVTTPEVVETPAVLAIAPITQGTTGKLKATIAEAAAALSAKAGTLTVALRDNGPKVNGTLVMVEGNQGPVGSAFFAKNSENGRPYGSHLVLGTVEYTVSDENVVDVRVGESDLDIVAETFAAPLFQA